MASKYPSTAIRVPVELMDKFKYVAGSNGRSVNKEIEQLMIKHVHDYVNQNGHIEINHD